MQQAVSRFDMKIKFAVLVNSGKIYFNFESQWLCWAIIK